MPIVHLSTLNDPRLADYRDIKDRQLRPPFIPEPSAESTEKALDPAAPSPVPPAPLGKFIAEGEVVFRMLARSPYRTLSVLATPQRLTTIAAELALLPPETPVYVLPAADLDALAGFPIHRGLLAVGARPAPTPIADILARVRPGRPLLVLEDLANHDNIGGVFRNAAAFGAAGVLLSPRCADPLYRKALRVSVGCVLALPWAFVDPWSGLASLLRDRAPPIAAVALTPAPGAVDLAPFAAAHADRSLALFLGAEGPGLSPAALAAADHRVRIPIATGIDSLNVAVASAVALDHLADRTR